MPAPSTGGAHTANDARAATAALEALAAALDAREFATTLVAGEGRVPCLTVASRYAKLSEDVYAQDGWLWWSWAERRAQVSDVATAAARIATVLRVAPERSRAGGSRLSPGHGRAL